MDSTVWVKMVTIKFYNTETEEIRKREVMLAGGERITGILLKKRLAELENMMLNTIKILSYEVKKEKKKVEVH